MAANHAGRNPAWPAHSDNLEPKNAGAEWFIRGRPCYTVHGLRNQAMVFRLELVFTNYLAKFVLMKGADFLQKEKKPNSLLRLLSFAGGYRKLTLLGCALSGVSAVLCIAPYVFVWHIIRGALDAMPDFAGAAGLIRWGWWRLALRWPARSSTMRR